MYRILKLFHMIPIFLTSEKRPYLPSDTYTDNPYYDYDTTTSQNEQINNQTHNFLSR